MSTVPPPGELLDGDGVFGGVGGPGAQWAPERLPEPI